MPGLQLSAQINNDISEVQSRNVVGAVKGKKYPDEYVLYMGHWDHNGVSAGTDAEDNINNGAVDNATGTSAILEIGEAFAQEENLDRSILIVAVTAEESFQTIQVQSSTHPGTTHPIMITPDLDVRKTV